MRQFPLRRGGQRQWLGHWGDGEAHGFDGPAQRCRGDVARLILNQDCPLGDIGLHREDTGLLIQRAYYCPRAAIAMQIMNLE